MAASNQGRSDDFERGLLLFNTGRFFECHEVWEVVWKRSVGAEKTLLQALIQAAAALLHLDRGNLRGARSTWAKARARFDSLPADLMNLDLLGLCTAIEAAITAGDRISESRVPQLLRIKPASP